MAVPNAVIKALADMPRRDNTAFHKAVQEARRAHDLAVEKLGGPVVLNMKYQPDDDAFTVTFTFSRNGIESSADDF